MPAEPAAGMPAEPYIADGTRAALAPLLALRSVVWKLAPAKTAGGFDTGLYLLGEALDTLHRRSQVDSEAAMARMLPQADERLSACASALRGLNEAAAANAIADQFSAVTAPVRDHLARAQAAQRVHSGPSAVLKIAPDEYLILCAQCQAPAERLRACPGGVSFSRCTGAMPARHYPRDRAAELFAQLEHDGADALCAGLDHTGRLIGYCPDCRALYCPAHYETQERWSGSWLEDLHGTCAKGHRRELA